MSTALSVQPKAAFAASRRAKRVHRIAAVRGLAESGRIRYQVTGLCGSYSTDAALVADPEPYGGVCRFCEARFSGAVVYRCHPADGPLLYIGSCGNWAAREALHRKLSPWWPEVARVDRASQPDLATAKRLEIEAIETEAPLHNKQHNPQRFRMAGHVWVPVAVAA